MSAVRVGVVGTGFGARVVAPTFAAVGCDVVDVVSARDDDAVAKLCQRRLDLVSIHSPPFLHAAHVRMALDAGCNVLCDKPFGRSVGEALAMATLAKAAGVVHLLNFEFRHEPARVRLKQLLGGGAIGTPEQVQWTAMNSGSRYPLRPMGWLFDRREGGGWIGAWGSHAIDAIRWLIGEITAAGARCRTTIAERPDLDGVMHACDAEDGFTAWLEFANGGTGAIDTTFAAPATLPTRIVICGSEGTIEVTNERHILVRHADGPRVEEELEGRRGDPHAGAMHRWAEQVRDAIAEGRQISPSFDDGVACARVMDAFRSGWDGTRIVRP